MTSILDKLSALEAGATAGPWEWEHDSIVRKATKENDWEHVTIIETDSRVYPPEDHDADFIMMSRKYMPLLLNVVRCAKEYVALWPWDDIASKNTSTNAVMVSPWCNEELIPSKELRDALAELEGEK